MMPKCRLQIWPKICLQIVDKQEQMLKIVDHSVCRLQTGDLFDVQICRLNFEMKDQNCRFFFFSDVDCRFLSNISVKSVDVDFLENQLVDCIQEGQIWCNLHQSAPHITPPPVLLPIARPINVRNQVYSISCCITTIPVRRWVGGWVSGLIIAKLSSNRQLQLKLN